MCETKLHICLVKLKKQPRFGCQILGKQDIHQTRPAIPFQGNLAYNRALSYSEKQISNE